MPVDSVELGTIASNARNLGKSARKVVELAVALNGDASIKWGTFGTTNCFVDHSDKSRAPNKARTLEMVCWLWPIYLAWRAKVAKASHLEEFDRLTISTMGSAAVLMNPTTKGQGYKAFGTRDESAMGAAAFYRASISGAGLGSPGDIVFYYREGYDQPCHIAVQVSQGHVSSLWNVPRDNKSNYYWHPQVLTNVELLQCIARENNGATSTSRSRRPVWH